ADVAGWTLQRETGFSPKRKGARCITLVEENELGPLLMLCSPSSGRGQAPLSDHSLYQGKIVTSSRKAPRICSMVKGCGWAPRLPRSLSVIMDVTTSLGRTG